MQQGVVRLLTPTTPSSRNAKGFAKLESASTSESHLQRPIKFVRSIFRLACIGCWPMTTLGGNTLSPPHVGCDKWR